MPSKATPAQVAQENDPNTRARESIAEIFDVLKITKAVYVDDIFESNDSQLDSLIGSLDAAIPEHMAELSELLPNIALTADLDVWDPQVREWWEDENDDEKSRVITEISALTGKSLTVLDYAASRRLKEILPENLPLIEVAPSTWDQSFLDGATAEARVLCLIDREFTYSRDVLPERITDGTDVLKAAVANPANEEVVFALFSHTFSPGEELQEWRSIAIAKELETDQFLPFSKRREANVLEFAIQLEMVVLNMFCDRLKKTAIESWERAQSEAETQFRNINVYEFEKMVLESTWKEGTWEPDTLFRIFQIFHRDAARTDVSRTEVAERVNTNAMLARRISKCRIHEPDPNSQERWSIRHRELYEDGSSLNAFHAPLRTGDLFVDSKNHVYILLAQPCDLIVRTDSGARKNRHVSLVTVKPLTRKALESDRKKAVDKGHADFLATRGVLTYFIAGKDDLGLARFSENHVVAAELLDLAVLDPDGRCRIDVREEWAEPAQLSIGWRQRARELREEFKKRADLLEQQDGALAGVEAGDRKAIWRALMPALAPPEMKLTEIPYSGGVFDFGLRRCGHLREPGATRLLAAYTRYLSREAEEHDFGR